MPGLIGQTIAMEGVFSFFLESTCLGPLVYGQKRLSPKLHWACAFQVFLGSWLSGYFIIATDAWMRHPTGYKSDPAAKYCWTVLRSWLSIRGSSGSISTTCWPRW
jgi:cytochrome d ubiquinol oxidase subunit I